ncbi:hypothetical protein CVD28_03440 [Bacillus sp. M6-12]|uniref:lipoprotein n=1 Tax=Bacillus sp. M6-12 TaxID=2054166 RepID=UPI000C779777|nr:lipoprotein [Bacillus sp. M6-12]PLS19483.1 hypothetical protein CVD28_03440 [Bacillus sp. M6-12]
MKKSGILFLFIVVLLTGCGFQDTEKIAPAKEPVEAVQTLTKEQQEEQEKRWQEEQEMQQKMNQDAVNTMTMMIPAIM